MQYWIWLSCWFFFVSWSCMHLLYQATRHLLRWEMVSTWSLFLRDWIITGGFKSHDLSLLDFVEWCILWCPFGFEWSSLYIFSLVHYISIHFLLNKWIWPRGWATQVERVYLSFSFYPFFCCLGGVGGGGVCGCWWCGCGVGGGVVLLISKIIAITRRSRMI